MIVLSPSSIGFLYTFQDLALVLAFHFPHFDRTLCDGWVLSFPSLLLQPWTSLAFFEARAHFHPLAALA